MTPEALKELANKALKSLRKESFYFIDNGHGVRYLTSDHYRLMLEGKARKHFKLPERYTMASNFPTVNGTPTYKLVSLHYIDASGDVRSDSLQVPTAATNAEIQAYADASGDLSNGSLYKVEVSEVYNSVPDKSDATDAPKDSVYDNLVFLAKDATNASKRTFIPAPLASLFVAGTDEIDPASVPLGVYLTAVLALVAGTYSITQARYTERREINEAVKI